MANENLSKTYSWSGGVSPRPITQPKAGSPSATASQSIMAKMGRFGEALEGKNLPDGNVPGVEIAYEGSVDMEISAE